MALIVEDGTGMATADSYASLADASAYAAKQGLTFAITGDDEALAEQALRRATIWLDGAYRSRFGGLRKLRRDQALEWPRIGVVDNEGVAVSPDTVPPEIVKATIEAAVREKADPGSLNPDITTGKIKSSVSVGEVSVSYAVGSGSAQEQKPFVGVIAGILAPLLGSGMSVLSGEAYRG